MPRTRFAALGGIFALALLAAPATTHAQSGDRAVSLLAGGFTYDYAGDGTFPIAALRLDRRISGRLVSEVGVSYARVDVTLVEETATDPLPREARSNIFAATVGLQAELPLRHATPFVGIASGLFGRFDPEGGDRFVRMTTQFPIGLKVPLGSALGLRGEARFRLDEHQSGSSAADTELLIGLSWSF
jgi:hypothetical protein